MRRRVLVIGAGGQLGRALTEEFFGTHETLETVYRNPRPDQKILDLSEFVEALRFLDRMRPEWVLIAGAFCHVDRCETEPDLCRQVNVEGTQAVAQWAHGAKAAVVYYSTDHVFDGTTPSSWETDPVHPLNAYAASKVEGERVLRAVLPKRHLILRTSGLYGQDSARKNFVIRLADRLRSGETVRVPSDQWGSPTYTQDLARATRFLLERELHGTYHATGPDFLSRIELARRICSDFGLDERRIIPTPTSELRQPARRPLRVRLNTEKLGATGAPAFHCVQEGLASLREFVLQGIS